MDDKKSVESLLQASSMLLGALELNELLKKMLNLVSDVFECEKGRIYLLDETRGDLMLEMAQGEGADSLSIHATTEASQAAAGSGTPVLIENSAADPRLNSESSAQSVLCVPMHFDQHLIGVIEIINKKNGEPFDYGDLSLFQGFGNICAAAVTNARKYLFVNAENRKLKEQLQSHPTEIIGNSRGIKKVVSLIKKVAPTDTIVLITGESGTGKEVVARAIHRLSGRHDKPFLPVNCGALPETLLESELFGHEKGAFTGAERARAGIFEEAIGGTVFLDEIGETSPATQVKLLRVLQENKIKRVGSNVEIKVDVRILSATNQNLRALIETKRFREDLFYRLNVVNIIVPPLRERLEDLPVLADFFLRRSCRKIKSGITGISPTAIRRFYNHPWKGNVRELENAIESAVALSNGPLLELDDLPAQFEGESGESSALASLFRLSYDEAKAVFEREYFSGLLKSVDGNTHQAAQLSKISEKSVSRRKQRYKL